MRIMSFQLPSGRQCQINRVEGNENSRYLTKVDALHIYPFKDCQLVVLVPPYIDYRTLLIAEAKLIVSTVWVFEPFAKSNSRTARHEVSSPQAPPNKPPSQGKPSDTYGGQTKLSCPPKDVSEVSRQAPAYTPPAAAPPPTPLSHSIQPHQGNPFPSSVDSVLDGQIPPGQTLEPRSSQDETSDTNKVTSGPRNGPNQGSAPKVAPTISPTVTWTNPPDSQALLQLERSMGDMAVDLEGIEGNCMGGNNEDCDMPPAMPNCCVTPDSKGIRIGTNSGSSQKDPLPARKPHCGQQNTPRNSVGTGKSPSPQRHGAEKEGNQPNPNTHSSPSPDPISPVSSLPDYSTPKVKGATKHANSDPITVTPPASAI